jgi:hypothetical protein
LETKVYFLVKDIEGPTYKVLSYSQKTLQLNDPRDKMKIEFEGLRLEIDPRSVIKKAIIKIRKTKGFILILQVA